MAKYQSQQPPLDAADLEGAEAEARAAQFPLVSDLAKVGVEVRSVWDLVNQTRDYSAALPVLLEHMHRNYPDKILGGVARALAVPKAAFAWDELAELYAGATGVDTKDGLAIALWRTANSSRLEQMETFILDESNGESRIFLVCALARIGNFQTIQFLEQFFGHPYMEYESKRSIKKLRRKSLRQRGPR